jgi:hypothetical protein
MGGLGRNTVVGFLVGRSTTGVKLNLCLNLLLYGLDVG